MIPIVLLFLAISPADWVPMRWVSPDPASLELLADSPINCLIVDPVTVTAEFRQAAQSRNIDLVALGDSSKRAAAVKAGIPFLESHTRGRLSLDTTEPILATEQGVWPGINTAPGDAEAMPSGAPWIDTNAGFFRFARASTKARIWIANLPPSNQIIPASRYIQAIADAAVVGGSWVVALDEDLTKQLLAQEGKAVQEWKQINAVLRFFRDNRKWESYAPAGQMAVVQDVESGGLLSGGVLDMIATKHTPVRPVPVRRLKSTAFEGTRMAVNTSPGALSADQSAILQQFTKFGGTVLSAPPGWKMPVPRADQVTLDKGDVEKLDQIWKEVNSMTNRQNLGVRLFNVSSMLSNMTVSPDGGEIILQLVNFSDYPIEDITVHLQGKVSKAELHTPEKPPQPMELFEVDEGSGAEISKIISVGTIVFKRE